jgi:cobalt-zinc-cadmium efflux system membrane fusion protein
MTAERSRSVFTVAVPLFVTAAATLLSACGEAPAPDAVAQPVVQGEALQFREGSAQLKVLASQVAQTEGERAVTVSGRLVWDETVTTRLFAPVAGRITSLEAKPGDFVRKGQVLARLSSPEFGQAQAEARRAQADLGVAEKAAARQRELGAAGVVARKDVEAAEADLVRARAEHHRASARLRAYGAGEADDQIFALASPIGAMVVERNANIGQEFRPDQAAPGTPALFVLSDPTRLWAQLELPEGAIANVFRGQEVLLTADAVPDAPVTAKVEYVPDGIDPLTRTLRVRASVPNPGRRFKAEMFARGALKVKGSGSPVVPASAVMLVAGRQVLFVDKGQGRYERRAVRAEDAAVERMRIVEGLREGERVVTEGALFLQQVLAGGQSK